MVKYYLVSLENDPEKFEKLYLPDSSNLSPLAIAKSYDVNFDEIKLLFYKHTSPDFAEYCLKSVTNKKDYTLEVKISGKLPNEDLRRRFLQRKGVQKYLDCIAQNKSVAGNFEGLFKEIQPDLDELFARFGIKYIID